MENICKQYLKVSGEAAKDYWLWCGQLTGEVAKWYRANHCRKDAIEELRIYPFESFALVPSVELLDPNGDKYTNGWTYHSVVIMDGCVHDLWFDGILTIHQYLTAMFPSNTKLLLKYGGFGVDSKKALAMQGTDKQFSVIDLTEDTYKELLFKKGS